MIFTKESKKFTANPVQPLEATTVAKWLVPSVSALFLVVGYVVQWAFHDLLGVSIGEADSTTYVANAAGFFRDLVTIAADAVWRLVTRSEPVSLAGYGRELAGGTAILVAALWPLRRLPFAVPHWLAAARLPVALVLLMASKFVLFDLPVTRIDSVLVGVGIVANTKNQQADGKPIESRLKQSEAHRALDRVVINRAMGIWSSMVCSRISEAALMSDSAESGLIQGGNPGIHCNGKGIAESQAFLRDAFAAHTLAACLLGALALSLIRSRTAMDKALGVLCTIYLLTWPYAYGKLLKSTYFEYGLVVLAFASPVDKSVPVIGHELGRQMAKGTLLHAIVLTRHSGGVDLLVAKQGTCSDKSIYQSTKVWTVPTSQLRAIQEIYQEDVIAWKILNTIPCLAAPSPNQVHRERLND